MIDLHYNYDSTKSISQGYFGPMCLCVLNHLWLMLALQHMSCLKPLLPVTSEFLRSISPFVPSFPNIFPYFLTISTAISHDMPVVIDLRLRFSYCWWLSRNMYAHIGDAQGMLHDWVYYISWLSYTGILQLVIIGWLDYQYR